MSSKIQVSFVTHKFSFWTHTPYFKASGIDILNLKLLSKPISLLLITLLTPKKELSNEITTEEIVKYIVLLILLHTFLNSNLFMHIFSKKKCVYDATKHHTFFDFSLYFSKSKLRQMKFLFNEKLFIAGIWPWPLLISLL